MNIVIIETTLNYMYLLISVFYHKFMKYIVLGFKILGLLLGSYMTKFLEYLERLMEGIEIVCYFKWVIKIELCYR